MKSYYLDTNIFIRFIARDNEEQYQQIKVFFQKASESKLNLILVPEVLAEITYVLLKFYKLPKDSTLDILLNLIETPYIEFLNDEKEMMIRALRIFSKHNIDMVDAMLLARSEYTSIEVFSFDKDLRKKILT
jgi:predicted nucleic-acid-binding protein